MDVISRFKQSGICLLLGLACSGAANAGSSGGITLGPPGGAAGPGGATAVPTLTTPVMIALGLLLAVVAIRFLQQKGVAQKVLSIGLLGGSLILAGFGVERATATTTATIPSEDSLCSGGTKFINGQRGGTGGGQITNECDSATLQVISYQLLCPPEEQTVYDADVGALIAPGVTVTMNQCSNPV